MTKVTPITLTNLRFQNGVLFKDALDLALRQGGLPLTTSCCTGITAAPTAGQVLSWDTTLNLYKPVTGGGGGGVASNLAYTAATSNGTIANSNGTGFVIPAATSSLAGLLTSTQFTQLSNAQPQLISGTTIKTINGTSLLGSGDIAIASGSTPANLALGTVTTTAQPITNSNGTGFTLPAATSVSAGLLTSTQFTQLSNLPTTALVSANSITGNGTSATPFKLVNDTSTPAATQYYGTNASSALGYYNLPVSSGGGLNRIFSGGADIKYFVVSGTPTVTFAKSGGTGTITATGGLIELMRVQVDLISGDLSSDTFTLVAPTTQSGAFLQFPSVTKVNRQTSGQTGGTPTSSIPFNYNISNNPGVQVIGGTAGTNISVQVINISSMNSTCSFVYNF